MPHVGKIEAARAPYNSIAIAVTSPKAAANPVTSHTVTYNTMTSLNLTKDAVPSHNTAVDTVTSRNLPNATGYDDKKRVDSCGLDISSRANSGEIRWSVRELASSGCSLHLSVTPHLYLQARMRLRGEKTCWELIQNVGGGYNGAILSVYHSRRVWSQETLLGATHCNHSPYFQALFSPHNHMHFVMHRKADVSIHFTTSPQFLKHTLPVVMLSGTQGYVTSPGYDGLCAIEPPMEATHRLTVPDGYDAVMVSIARLVLSSDEDYITCSRMHLSLEYVTKINVTVKKLFCRAVQRSVEVLHTRSLSLRFYFDVGLTVLTFHALGFKMHFSFHQQSELPVETDNGLFNCRSDFYPTFSRHLDCNNRMECEDGRDETGHCPFSSDACEGRLASGNKCFFLIFTNETEASHTDPGHMSRQCQKEGGTLAVIQTREEQDDVYKLLAFHDHCSKYLTGLVYGDKDTLTIYRQMWTGRDKSIVYTVFPFFETRGIHPILSPATETIRLYVLPQHMLQFATSFSFMRDYILDRETRVMCGAVCQSFSTPHARNRSISLYNLSSQTLTAHAAITVTTSFQGNLTLIVCPKKHLTHLFLSCYVNNVCSRVQPLDKCYFPTSMASSLRSNGTTEVPVVYQIQHTPETPRTIDSWREAPSQPVFVLMFVCESGDVSVHYTSVCDKRRDCPDGSDETFCSYFPCEQFTCSNGQCVPFYVVCDKVSDCLQDNLDEFFCDRILAQFTPVRQDTELPVPSLIEYDGRGYFTHTAFNATDPCPLTHYRCDSSPQHCLPVYTRCNRFYDCAGREDENDCDDPECPGYYRCRESPVCLHPDHLCDGWAQCPKGDDELLCDEKPCPASCLCQGLAFVCGHSFDAQHFPHLKYLEGSGSHLTLADLSSNHDLIYLSLRNCGLTSVPAMTFPNLILIDLSHNHLHNVSMNAFLLLNNLQTLSLAYNPLHALYSQQSTQKQNTLKHVDLSFTYLWSFNAEPFSNFLSLQRLNLSQSGMGTILNGGFQHAASLFELDLSGCPVENFPPDLFYGLSRLREIRADTFKLCCASILPSNFDHNFCFAPQDEISSCEDLVRSEVYRGLLWLVSFLSIFGNGFCLIYRLLVQKKRSKASFIVFVSSLCAADFVMGIYLAMIGVADLSYRGVYLHYDVTWTRSAVCRAAGFLSFLSNQVSAFTIALITLDRLIVLRFPFSAVRFSRRSANVAVTSSWIAGFVLAVVPLLPVTSHWQFYNQIGICIPLPITRSDFAGRSYSFAVVVVTNFILFLLIAGGQVAIYRSVLKNSIDWGTNSQSHANTATLKSKVKEATVARRLTTVAVTNFLCWFPIGFCGILSSVDYPIPGEVNVAVAILVLPLNAALNPFLYTLNVVMEIRSRATRERLQEALLSTLNTD